MIIVTGKPHDPRFTMIISLLKNNHREIKVITVKSNDDMKNEK